MSARESAEIFGKIFKILARNPTKETREIAKEVFKETNEYDFCTFQMGADQALEILGLEGEKGEDK